MKRMNKVHKCRVSNFARGFFCHPKIFLGQYGVLYFMNISLKHIIGSYAL